MTVSGSPRFTLTIRGKLLLVSLLLLLVPWVGAQYIREMESYLRQRQEQDLLSRAQMVAAVLAGKPDIFKTRSSMVNIGPSSRHIYVRPLHSPIQLDGYEEDWDPYADRLQSSTTKDIFYQVDDTPAQSISFRYQLGTRGKYLYAFFHISDDKLVYRKPGSYRLDQSDHLQISMLDQQGNFRRYLLTSSAPGWVNAHLLNTDGNLASATTAELRIKGEWQETATGYNIELRIPTSMLGDRLAFAIADVDDAQKRTIRTIIGTAGTDSPKKLGTIVIPSPEIEQLLERLKRPASRTWIIDSNYRVLAQAGKLTSDGRNALQQVTETGNGRSLVSGIMHLIYQAVLPQPAKWFQDELSSASRLDSAEVTAALQGTPGVAWRKTPDAPVNILTATHSIWQGQKVIGAIAIEETSNSILLLQNRAMEILINLSLVTFLVATSVLLIFATRLSIRVRRLRNAAEQAIASDGRVQQGFPPSQAGDEIGDLSRSFAEMLERLSHYNLYLESMAGKLSHEFRTPIAVVRSSLDNLEHSDHDSESRTYITRAREGIERLGAILTRMSEATRLEQTLQSEERINFDLHQVISGCVAGYRLAHPGINFDFNSSTPGQTLTISGVPDLIAQLMDKLIANAIDFHTPGSAICIELSATQDNAVLTIQNEGPPLPEQMHGNLFDSMVTLRTQRGDVPHLGLGLYIVRLIVEFHHGTVAARNRSDVSGASFSIQLPLTDNTARL